MPQYQITAPDGGTYEVTAPDGATEAQILEYAQGNYQAQPKPGLLERAGRIARTATPAGVVSALATPEGRKDVTDAVVGGVRGIKDVIDSGAELLAAGYDKVTGADKATGEAARVKAMNAEGKKQFDQDYAGSVTAGPARVGGNLVATWPVGGVLGATARMAGLTRLGNALSSGGFTTGAEVGPGLLTQGADMAVRMAGGGGAGYASARLIDPESANTGGLVGTLLPPAARVGGAAGNVLANVVRPFTSGGQDRIAGNALRQFATHPDEAVRNLQQAPEMVPGSAPTAVAAAGDEGLAGLSRTLQSASPQYAAELSARASAQNAARTSALEEVAGNTGRLDLARQARAAATDDMRESVLDAAGKLPARPVLNGIDRMMADPNNAGDLAQAALGRFRGQIAKFSPDGQIDARALYAIRKDINSMLEGKLQGEAGNLRHASGQLRDVKGLIDDAIDQGSRVVRMSPERALMPAGANIERAGAAGPYNNASMEPRPTWRGYLETYANKSVPIDQMEKLDEVLRGISTGSVDKSGNAILSAAKLNNLLRNQAKDLQKVLSPEQLDLLRRLAADLNASQLAATSGKAVGSNTVQNLSGVNALSSLVGRTLGNSTPVQATAGRAINWLYKKPDAQITNKLAEALLDPQEAARLMAIPEGNALLRRLSDGPARIGYRAAPALAVQQ